MVNFMMKTQNENRLGYKRMALGEVADIYSGGTPSRANPKFWGGNIPWVKTTQIKNSIIPESEVDEWITEEGFKKSSAKMIPKGTILMAMYGQGKTRGRVAVLGLNATINQACAAISLKSTANRNFVFQQLLSKYTVIRKMSNSGGQDNLSAGLIKEITISLPPLPEQKAIAGVLECWDRGIRNLELKIENKRRTKKGLMQRLLSGKLRLPGFSNDWKEKKIDEIFDVTRGQVLAVSKMQQNQNEKYCYPVYSSQTKSNGLTGYYTEHLYENAITWTTDGANAGDVKYRSGKFYCTNVCGVLLGEYTNQCIAEMLNMVSEKYVSYVGNPKLMNNVMAKIKITLPPLEEQQAIAKVLSAADGEIEVLERKLATWKDQKKFLLNNLVTGSIRLPEFRTTN